jgi:Cys-tRNA synthase (O-phospho-L-seryl-tRNA:Cys-tRNA synthase)
MKKLYLLALCALLFCTFMGCSNNNGLQTTATSQSNQSKPPEPRNNYNTKKNSDEKNDDRPVLHFIGVSQYDFGTIKNGESITHVFQIINKGTAPLLIRSAYSSCGCTVASFPAKPILPDSTGSIVAGFNSAGNGVGVKNKVITIISNATSSPDLVTLIGKVK